MNLVLEFGSEFCIETNCQCKRDVCLMIVEAQQRSG